MASHPLYPTLGSIQVINSINREMTSKIEMILMITSGCILIEILISIFPPSKHVFPGN